MQQTPVIGLICDHTSAVLEGLINGSGYRTIRQQADQITPDSLPEVDVWVVDCDDSDQVAHTVHWLDAPVLAISNRPHPGDLLPYNQWCSRIIAALEKWTGHIRREDGLVSASSAQAWHRVRGVWVLTGSTGAGTAMRRFLGALPQVPPLAFVYAQHVHQSQESTLTMVGRANSALNCYLGLGRHWLNPGHVLVVPATSQLRFGRYGEVFSTREPWQSPETPKIDEVLLAMCGMQPAPAGVIVFSGAGNDGCRGLDALSEVGTRIWAQDPETCEAPSMPQSAIDAGLTSLVASPEGLARFLVARYRDDTEEPMQPEESGSP